MDTTASKPKSTASPKAAPSLGATEEQISKLRVIVTKMPKGDMKSSIIKKVKDGISVQEAEAIIVDNFNLL